MDSFSDTLWPPYFPPRSQLLSEVQGKLCALLKSACFHPIDGIYDPLRGARLEEELGYPYLTKEEIWE